jgi:hypothetical protein
MPSPFTVGINTGTGGGMRYAPAAPAPVSEEPEMEEGNPPSGELGSSFMLDAPFGAWHDGNVFAYEEPLVRDYQHMLDTDGTAAAIEKMLVYPIISAPWSIEPSKGDTGEAEFIYDAFTALPHQGGPLTTVEQLVSQMTAAFTNKRAYFEKVFKLNDDGKVVYHKIAYRPPETCELALDSRRAEPRGFRQMPVIFDSASNSRPNWSASVGDWIYVPRERAFVYIHATHRNPLLGESDMKVPYWCFQTKRKIRWLWYQFLDQSVLPKTIVKNADETQARVDARKVSTLRGRGVVALLDSTTVESYESASKAADEYQAAMTYLDNEMMNSGLLGYMGLSSAAGEGKGSYALAESLSKMYLRTRRMVAMDMARQITNDVIGPLIAYNFGPKGVIPRFKFGPLSEANEVNVLDVFSKVATTGAKVPVEFYDQLITRVATLLELDPGKVAKVAQQLGTAVDTATKMVQDSQTQKQNDAARSGGGKAPVKQAATRGGGTVGTRPFGERSVVKPKQSRKRRP